MEKHKKDRIMKDSESNQQIKLFQWVRLHEKKYPQLQALYAIPNGGQRNITTAARLKREGTKAGVWDIHLPIANKHFIGLWIEMKFGKNKLTPSQEHFKSLLAPSHRFVVCYTWEEAKEALLDYLGIYE